MTDIITKHTAKELTARIMKALEKEFEGSGYVVSHEGGRYRDLEFLPKLKIALVNEDGENAQERTNFEFHCSRFGLEKTDFGRVFTNGDFTYKIIGINVRKRKYPITCIGTEDGKQYSFTPLGISIALTE